ALITVYPVRNARTLEQVVEGISFDDEGVTDQIPETPHCAAVEFEILDRVIAELDIFRIEAAHMYLVTGITEDDHERARMIFTWAYETQGTPQIFRSDAFSENESVELSGRHYVVNINDAVA